MTAAEVPTWVYEYFDRRGLLLYVGVTGNPDRRNEEHWKTARWYRYVGDYKLTLMPSRALALELERVWIKVRGPVFNATGRQGWTRALAAYYAACQDQSAAHPIMTCSDATDPGLWRITCGFCPSWEVFAGNPGERDRWIAAHRGLV